MEYQDTGFLCHESLPLTWSVIDPDSLAGRQRAVAEQNAERLQVIAGLDDHAPEPLDDHPGLTHELQRLDFKLNVILEMVSRLYGAAGELPSRVPVGLGSSRVGFTTADAPAVGQVLQIELYLYPRYVFPVVLFGTVDSVAARDDAAAVTVTLTPMADDAQELFEKAVFRCHRRQVARQRRPE